MCHFRVFFVVKMLIRVANFSCVLPLKFQSTNG